jgi:hypothetical protein
MFFDIADMSDSRAVLRLDRINQQLKEEEEEEEDEGNDNDLTLGNTIVDAFTNDSGVPGVDI